MKHYPLTSKYDLNWITQNWMGPNPLWLAEDLCANLDLRPGMKILDMGCGKGLTSVFLAKEYGVTVFANDLWISAKDNLRRFEAAGVDDLVYPIRAEAHALPYAEGFFDAVVSIDSYHYFGADENYFPGVFAKLVKPGGQLGIVVPGLTKEFEQGYPAPMRHVWAPELFTFHSGAWWRQLWEKTGLASVTACYDIEGPKEIWRPWAEWARDNMDFSDIDVDLDGSGADIDDVEFLDADTGDDIALIVMTARKNQ